MPAAPTPGPAISRRTLLTIAAAAGISAVGGYALFEYTPWLNDQRTASQIRKPLDKSASGSAQMLELVRYATLAASSHNSQPWKFAVGGDSIEIHPDRARALSVVDPTDRELWISLGAALENLAIAARAAGYTPSITYPDSVDFIRVGLTPQAPEGGPLFDAIPMRQSTRSDYDGLPIGTADLGRLHAVSLEPGIALHFAAGADELGALGKHVAAGDLDQYSNRAFVSELIAWLRFDRREALAGLDGLYSRCSGNLEVPRWLGQWVVSSTKPQQQADTDAKRLLASSGAIVVASAGDSKSDWVRAGQVFGRLALTLTSLGLKSSLMNQPVEVAAVRGQLQQSLRLGAALPQMVVRYGHAQPMPLSERRSADQLLVRS